MLEPASFKAMKKAVAALMPRVDLPDLVLTAGKG